MSAKSDLMVRLKYLSQATNLPSLIDNGLTDEDHNGVANLLRKGLGIVAFNILEDYIKQKAIESLDMLSNSGIQFSDLTDELQKSSIFEALNSLNFRSDIIKRNGSLPESISLIQTEAFKIHSTSLHPFQLSSLSLVSTGSNVNDGEISTMIRAFGIAGGWDALRQISNGIGGGIPDLAQAYKNAASRRHRAAHTATYQYDYLWISNVKNEILAIAASLDILLSARCRQVNFAPNLKLNGHNLTLALNYRFLEPREDIYRETKVIGGKSRKNWLSLQEATSMLCPLLIRRNEFLIILNSSRRIEDWYV
jgi:hypothetical protein